MKNFLLAATILFTSHLQAQFTYDYLKAADNYYQKADYYSAAQYYEKYLANNKKNLRMDAYDPYAVQSLTKQAKKTLSNKQQVVYKLAESYRQLNFPAKAAPYYKEALAFDQKQYLLAGYYYAAALKSLEQFDAADSAYTSFLAAYATEDIYKKTALQEKESLVFVKTQLKKDDLKYYTVTKADALLNKPGATYAPVWLNNNTLFFTSTRSDSTVVSKKEHLNKIYQASYNESGIQQVERVNVPEVAEMHQGVVAVTPNGNTLFITRWTIKNGKRTAAIYSSTKQNNIWSEPTLLDSLVNATGSNNQQPFVTPDGKYLLFSSDRGSGEGGYDIWAAPLQSNGTVTGTPVNAGSTINTIKDEQAPYYHAATNTLVFASNGRVGMGGYDLYSAKGNIGSFSTPVNFGYPVNSVKDDMYLVSRGNAKNILQEAMLSSDRASECCLEMFTLSKKLPLKTISGLVVACDNNTPIVGATVTVKDANQQIIASKTTDASGGYSFTLPDYQPLQASASATGFLDNSLTIERPASEDVEALTSPALCLGRPRERPPVDTSVVMENVQFEFNKYNLSTDSKAGLDYVVEMMNKYPTMQVEISAHTDNLGEEDYNLNLSQNRANACTNYIINKGIDASRLTSKDYGETKPLYPNQINGKDNPEGRRKNRRVEFKVMKY